MQILYSQSITLPEIISPINQMNEEISKFLRDAKKKAKMKKASLKENEKQQTMIIQDLVIN